MCMVVARRCVIGLFLVASITAGRPAAADAPRILEMFPANGATDVDPTIRELRVVFDRDMSVAGYSFCGGGPKFPKSAGKTGWTDKRTIVMKVKLEPDHDYRMSLNCGSAQNFRSANGVALKPVPWSFRTARRLKKRESGDPRERLDAPQVVEMLPPDGATDVDPTIRELRVVFDRDMSTGGYSFCGGGPTFPESAGKTGWTDKRTIVMKVKLEPDHDYRMSLNCRDAENFRSADGVPLRPVRWSFSTAPGAAELTMAQQKELNTRCLAQLMGVLRDYYSYYDLRGIDWKALEQKHRETIVAAASTRSWVKAAATMLSKAEDMHMWLTYRGNTTPTHKREIRCNYDMDGIRNTLPGLQQRNGCVYTARTDDNIGYIMIDTLSRSRTEQLERVQDYLAEFKDCKALIVDLRPNGGGAEPLALPIAAWFVEGTKIYAKHVTRDPDAKNGFTEPYERTITGNEEPRRFDKPVAVLSGPGVMSSAEAFLLMCKQGENVTVIGEPTFGSSGNPKPHSLESGVEFFVPSWKAMRPDGTCFEGEGIKPDINVRARKATLKERDPAIKRALKHLRKRT